MPADAHGSAGTSTACKRGTTTRPRRSTAPYTETVETRINGEAVPGQSTRAVTWITAEGQRVREENYLLLSTRAMGAHGQRRLRMTRRTGG